MRRKLLIAVIGIIVINLICVYDAICASDDSKQFDIKKGDSCRICGMYIERFKKTASYVEYTDGKTQYYCGVSCAIRSINEKGGFDSVKSAEVTGWTSQERVPMKEATYVIGSSLIPDMLPNIIAFESKESADSFINDKGGKVESLDSLMVSTSYRGMTMPFRIPSAALPPQGVFSVGSGFNFMRMDKLMRGDTKISKTDAYRYRMMAPDTMTTYMFMQFLGYAFSDDFFSMIMMPYIAKEMKSINRRGNIVTTRKDGVGDISIANRWRVWHDMDFDKHLSIYGAVGVPTGRFNNSLRSMPGMQLGTGAFSFTPGLLYSQHVGDFWFHAAGTYKFNTYNSDDYKFGDNINYGFAIHYLPNTSDLLGVEIDACNTLVDSDNSRKVENTGRTSLYYNFVYQKRIFLFWGGNLSVNALFGLPAYEFVKNVQLGESYHTSIQLQWQRRF